MAVAYFFDMPHGSDVATQISAHINERRGSRQPEGGLYHAEGPSDTGGWWSFNVWASEAQFQTFFDTYVQPAVAHMGIDPVTPRRLEVAWDTSQVSGSADAEADR